LQTSLAALRWKFGRRQQRCPWDSSLGPLLVFAAFWSTTKSAVGTHSSGLGRAGDFATLGTNFGKKLSHFFWHTHGP
jgi:hypothetical protein